MKKIFGFIALVVALAATFSSCDNRPPYVRLAAAIDSLNAQYEQVNNTKDKYITYEKWENVVHFHIDYPAVIEAEVFEPIAANIKENFLRVLVTDDEFGIATEIIDAKSNIVIDIHGLNDTKYEVLIVTNEIIAAFDAAHPAVEEEEPAGDEGEPADTLSPEQIEQELLEGNVPSIEKQIEESQN